MSTKKESGDVDLSLEPGKSYKVFYRNAMGVRKNIQGVFKEWHKPDKVALFVDADSKQNRFIKRDEIEKLVPKR